VLDEDAHLSPDELDALIRPTPTTETFNDGYNNAASEGQGELEAFRRWPTSGRIEFKDVCLRYRSEADVLKRVSFAVRSGERIGVSSF
jgi:ABC-type multidrug transport system fused ATPase/permease subunit